MTNAFREVVSLLQLPIAITVINVSEFMVIEGLVVWAPFKRMESQKLHIIGTCIEVPVARQVSILLMFERVVVGKSNIVMESVAEPQPFVTVSEYVPG